MKCTAHHTAPRSTAPRTQYHTTLPYPALSCTKLFLRTAPRRSTHYATPPRCTEHTARRTPLPNNNCNNYNTTITTTTTQVLGKAVKGKCFPSDLKRTVRRKRRPKIEGKRVFSQKRSLLKKTHPTSFSRASRTVFFISSRKMGTPKSILALHAKIHPEGFFG